MLVVCRPYLGMQTALALRFSQCGPWYYTHYHRSVFNQTRSTSSALNHPAFSRKMYSFTLKDLKGSEWGDHEMADTAFRMKKTGFHRWGFVVYRTT